METQNTFDNNMRQDAVPSEGQDVPNVQPPQPQFVSQQERHEFDEFKRQKRVAEARALIAKIELSATSVTYERSALRRALKECEKLGIGGVCVLPYLVKSARSFLGEDSPVIIVALISPFGGTDTTDIKLRQVKRALRDGAAAVEVTVPVPAIKEGSWGYVKKELKRLKRASRKAILRINLEAPLLTSQELTRLLSIICEVGITCVRTAGGVFGSGADEEDLKLIRAAVKDKAMIKAEGAEAPGRMATLLELGAQITGSEAAVPMAQAVLAAAEK